MARIAGVDIPRDKRVEIALTYVYGIGLTRAQKILAKSGVSPDIRVKDLSDADVQKLRGAADSFTLEGDLRRQEGMAMKRLQDIGCVRGRRHRMGLPVRGQRTRTNARTRRGARKTVAGKKKYAHPAYTFPHPRPAANLPSKPPRARCGNRRHQSDSLPFPDHLLQ